MTALNKCPIWGTVAVVKPQKHQGRGIAYFVVSERAGGKYCVIGHPQTLLGELSSFDRALISTWILEQNQNGVGWPEIFEKPLATILSARPLTVSDRLERLLREIRRTAPILGDSGEYESEELYAKTECINADGRIEIIDLLAHCQRNGLVTNLADNHVELTVEGHIHVDSLDRPRSDSKQIFVAMWFNKALDDAYTEIAGAIRDAGFEVRRIDQTDHNNKIDDEIIAEIRKSRAMIVDLTCGLANPLGEWSASPEVGAPRGGVYFEAGFALGLGLPVIWTCRDDVADLDGVVHFDVRQYNQIRWNAADLPKLRKDIKNRIEATIV